MLSLQLSVLACDIAGLAPHNAGEAAVGNAGHDAADAKRNEAGELYQDVALHAVELGEHQGEDN